MRKTLGLFIVIFCVIGAIIYLESQKANPAGIISLQEKSPMATGSPVDNLTADSSEGLSIAETLEPAPSPLVLSNYVLDDATKKRIKESEKKYLKSPELAGISGYLNIAEGTTIESLRGKVVLIDFWTYTCINCIRTLPYLVDWDAKYREKGLVIIGVHTPEFTFEKDKANVLDAMEKYGIIYPVVQDNDYLTWRAFNNRYWPRKYLIDQDGFIRYDHIGEGGYAQTEYVIQTLLEETGEKASMPYTDINEGVVTKRLTAELYAGYGFALDRNQNIGNGGFSPDQEKEYVLPSELKNDVIYLNGTWKSEKDGLVAVTEGTVVLSFQASQVNIVADTQKPAMIDVRIDGDPLEASQEGQDIEPGSSGAIIDQPRLYNIYKSEHGRYVLTLNVQPGFSFNAFTFG